MHTERNMDMQREPISKTNSERREETERGERAGHQFYDCFTKILEGCSFFGNHSESINDNMPLRSAVASIHRLRHRHAGTQTQTHTQT